MLTLLCSFLILFFFNNTVQKDSKFLKPASWLSVVVAADTLLLNAALLEGLTIAWWYQASRRDVNHSQLHETWRMGTSVLAVLRSGKKFNYVAMAFTFVAMVPLNGFLLQNAISTYPGEMTNHTELYLPMVERLPLGFSADVTNGSLDAWSQGLISAASSWEDTTALPPGNFYTALQYTASGPLAFQMLGCINNDLSATCKTNVTIAGFNMTCTRTMDESYDLSLEKNDPKQSQSWTVFSSEVLWDPSMPYTIDLSIMYKPNQTCQGYFERTNCRLMAANMSIPLQIFSDGGYFTGSGYNDPEDLSPVISVDMEAEIANYTYQGEISTSSEEGKKNSTYGGIAQWLGEKFNSSINWTLTDGTWSTSSRGLLAKSYYFMPTFYPQSYPGGPPIIDNSTDFLVSEPFTPGPRNSSWCKNVYLGLDWLLENDFYDGHNDYSKVYPNITETIFTTLNQLILGAYINEAAMEWSNILTSNITNWFLPCESLDSDDEMMECFYGTLGKLFRDRFSPIHNVDQTQDVLYFQVRYGYYGASVAITMTIALMILPLYYGFWTLDHKVTLSPFETAAAFRAPGYEGVDTQKEVKLWLREMGARPVHASDPSSSLPLPPQPAMVSTIYKP